ncbi:aldo/keto reductase [Nonomuraea sp. NPDC046570]|uniref:aldo/keto reductase n=1 Tax=Nonomuraea sp. NPDC046570 TaxID=3155255 RepID=UPI0033C033E5
MTEYRVLGRTGLKVSPLCLGAMMFGSWGEPSVEESSRIIERALDAGVNFIDTADVYSQGQSEEFVGRALVAGGWLSGRYRKGRELLQSRRAGLLPARYDMSIEENRRKLDAVEALAVLAEQARLTLIELALAFTLRHPGVTSAIIGPRTMEHLEGQLSAADVTLSDDVLDRIDEIVAPGRTVNPGDDGWQPPALAEARLRRR